VYRAKPPVLLRGAPGSVEGSCGTRIRDGCYLKPCDPFYSGGCYSQFQLGVESPFLSPVNSLLFVNKQTYIEALPHVYRNTTFFFDDSDGTEEFVETVGNHCLKHIGAIEVFTDEWHGRVSDDDFFSFIVASDGFWGLANHTRIEEAVEEMIRTGDQRALDRARVAILKQGGHDIAVSDFETYGLPGQNGFEDGISGLSDVIDRSGLSKEWWLQKLNA
jgi:hypothetical protein